jgi:predicted Zn-dependent protease
MFRHRSIHQYIVRWFWAGLVGIVLFWGTLSGSQPSVAQAVQSSLPPFARHPMPVSLESWVDDGQGDYFDEVKPVDEIGYLVWPTLPVTVYIEPPTSVESDRSQVWFDLVQQAVDEWSVYLPMESVPRSADANITIWRDNPSIQSDSTGQPRARSAETRYRVYVETIGNRQQLTHQMTVIVRPGQPDRHLVAAARHELGHALGIWGHSPNEADALYFSQVRQPPGISSRDVSTLKRVYEQPTRLGWIVTR